MHQDVSRLTEGSSVGVMTAGHDDIQWRARWQLDKLLIPDSIAALQLPAEEEFAAALAAGGDPFERLVREGNLLMYGGVSCLWQCLIGNGTATASQALTYFNNAQAGIGSGDSTTAAAATQTDLQASTNKIRKAMDSTYPQHTDATTSGAASIVYRSTFGTSDANWAWQEWGVFNSTTAATGRMLNRKVESLGTKTSAASWQFSVTLSLS